MGILTQNKFSISSIIFVLILSVGALAIGTTANYVVTGGSDVSDGSSTAFTTNDIGDLNVSDDSRMQSDGNWPDNTNNYDETKYIEFLFLPSVPSDATINSVTIYHEYQRTGTLTGAKLDVWDGTVFNNESLNLPGTTNTDINETKNVTSYINTPSKVNSLKARFLAYRSTNGNAKTRHDLINARVTFNQAPIVTVTSPNGGEIWKGTKNIAWNASDADGDALTMTIQKSTDGASWTNIATGEANDGLFAWDTTTTTDSASYLIRVIASDGQLTGQDDSNAVFTIDNLAPTTTDNAPAGWQNSDVTVTLTPSDTASGVANTSYCVDQSNSCVPASSGTSVLVSSEGTNYIRYMSTDNSGNIESIKSATVQIDKTPPTISGEITIGTLGENGWYVSDVTVEFNCADEVSGIDFCTEPVALTENGAEQSATGKAIDNAGNSNETSVSNIDIDKTAPTSSLDVGEPNFPTEDGAFVTSAASTEFTLTAEDNEGGSGVESVSYKTDEDDTSSFGSTGGTFTLEGFSEGEHTITYWSEDAAGNIEEEKFITAIIDDSPPITAKNIEGRILIKQSTQISLEANDGEGAGVNSTYYRFYLCNSEPSQFNLFEDSFTINEEGCHTIEFYSTDKLGNKEEFKSQNHTVLENIPPITTKTYGEPNREAQIKVPSCDGDVLVNAHFITTNTTVTLDAVDNEGGSGVANTSYEIKIPVECRQEHRLRRH